MIMNKNKTEPVLKKVSFLSDSYTLKGVLHMPHVQLPPVVVGAHGLLSTSESPKQIELARQCNALGIAYLRFDHRGCGKSSGDFKKVTSLEARCKDLTCAIEMIYERNDTGDRVGLFGSSLGGAVCISAASEIAIDALVTFAAPVRSSSILDAVRRSDDYNACESLLSEKKLEFDIAYKLEKINNILIFHGDADTVVPPYHAKIIYEKAGLPKKIILQKGGDHSMSCKEYQKTFAGEASFWFQDAFS